MAAEPKPKAAAKKKRRRAAREEFVDYVVEIEGWDWGYSLSLNTEKHPVDPYHEFRHLQITGKLLRPAGLKTDMVEVSLLPTFSMGEEQRVTDLIRRATIALFAGDGLASNNALRSLASVIPCPLWGRCAAR
jgi:hypothetical protein